MHLTDEETVDKHKGVSQTAGAAGDAAIRFVDHGLMRHRVVDALRDAIIAGRLKPGERIRERELVSLLGVSRSPLREAIRILETEGLITSLAYRGARVSELSATDLHDMLDVRIMLESFAARLFIERLDDRALQAMQEQVERARAPGYQVDLQANFDLGLEFHDLLVRGLRQPQGGAAARGPRSSHQTPVPALRLPARRPRSPGDGPSARGVEETGRSGAATSARWSAGSRLISCASTTRSRRCCPSSRRMRSGGAR